MSLVTLIGSSVSLPDFVQRLQGVINAPESLLEMGACVAEANQPVSHQVK